MNELRLMWGTAPVGVWVHDGHLFESLVQTVSDRRLLVAAVLERHWDDFFEVDLVVRFAIDGSHRHPEIDLAAPIVERIPRGASSQLVALARLQLAVAARNAPDHVRFDGRVDLHTTWPSPRGHLIIEDVARACAEATERAAASGDSRFVAPVLLDHDRPDADHLLARLEPTDLGSLADVLIVTAVKDEYQAVLGVDTGAVPGSAWQPRTGPTRLEVAFRAY